MKIQDLLESTDDQLIQDWKASRKTCARARNGDNVGASARSSCRSQKLLNRDSEVEVTIKGKRQKIGRRKIAGRKYGGPLPDYSKKKKKKRKSKS